MKTQNAIAKLQKEGFSVQLLGELGKFNNRYKATKEGHQHYIEFLTQDDELIVIDLRRKGEEDDPMTDYHAGTFCKNLKQALVVGEF